MGAIRIIKEKCTGCNICVQICPFNSISIVEDIAVISESCSLCGACVSDCPFNAIEIIEEKEEIDLFGYKGVLIFGEQQACRVAPVVNELIGKGRKLADTLGEELNCVILGRDVKKQAEDLICYGVDKIFIYDDPCLANFRDDPYTDLIVDLVKKINPNIFLIGATSIGRTLGPRIASKLKTGLTADCTGLKIDPETKLLLQTRPAFGGNIMATIICPNNRPQMATVRYKIMKRAEKILGYRGEVIKMKFAPEMIRDRVKVKEIIKEEANVNIIEAEIIVSGGNGLGNPEGFKLIGELAKCLGGVVGASRVAVDKGWINYLHQIGLSGKTVRPKLYIACGISGSVQHLAGMSRTDFIMAINNDLSAPIFNVADIGLVGDLYEIIPELIKEIKKNKHGINNLYMRQS